MRRFGACWAGEQGSSVRHKLPNNLAPPSLRPPKPGWPISPAVVGLGAVVPVAGDGHADNLLASDRVPLAQHKLESARLAPVGAGQGDSPEASLRGANNDALAIQRHKHQIAIKVPDVDCGWVGGRVG